MRRYGFVSAGHGDKYRKAMGNLFIGARVWAAIPGTGYVGVGEVTAPAVGVNEFEVELDGKPCRSCRRRFRPRHGRGRGRSRLSEYLARVRWLDARERGAKAFWEKGMFANQNVVAKLRQPFTLQRLAEHFDLDGAAE